MKKHPIQIFILMSLLLLSVGCTTYVKENNKNVINESTGMPVVSNILCKPVTEDLYNIYQEHSDSLSIDLETLPKCSEFKPSDIKYNNLWESLLIKPLAWLILKLGQFVNNYGISVMIMSLLIRLIMMPFTKKTMLQSENMKKAQPEIEKLERKYKNKNDNESLMAKSQEQMMVYKKYNINPVSGCLMSFIQLPLFFAFLEAINRVPAIFEDNLFGMNLGITPTIGLRQGNYVYLLLIIIIIATTYLSFKITMSSQATNTEAAQQMKFMMTFMLIMISIASLSLSTAIALYWVVNNLFAIIQNIVVKKLNERRN